MLLDGTAQVARVRGQEAEVHHEGRPANDDDTRPRDDDKPSTVTVRGGSIVNFLDPKDLSKVLKTVRIKQDIKVTLAKTPCP